MTQQNNNDKTTIRLSQEDRELAEKLGKALAYKLGRVGHASLSDVIRYSLRQTAERELVEGGNANG